MNTFRKYLKKATIPLVLVAMLSVLVVNTGFVRKNFYLTMSMDIFLDMFGELVFNYVDEFDPSQLMHVGIDAMLNSLDPHTEFIPNTRMDEIMLMTTGQFGGIGIVVHQKNGHVFINDIYEDSPAERAGLQLGDRIIEINGEPTMDRPFAEVREMMRGEAGSLITLSVGRYGAEEARTIEMRREVMQIDNISYYGVIQGSKTGYIALEGFTGSADREVIYAFNYLKREHDIENLIIDLRNNSGGLVEEAINIINLFVERNKEVVKIRSRIEERNMSYKTLNRPLDLEIPLAIIVNENSASASEVVAGVIQDLDRGIIIGQRTFGKGSVQRILPLSYNSALKVTVARYYIPSGRSVQKDNLSQEEGDQVSTPDSLETTYTTANGRIVLGGGGIRPDIATEPIEYSNITLALYNGAHIFDFADYFFRNNRSIPQPRQFAITDRIYNDFVKFLEGRDYSYSSESELVINYLRSIAERDNHLDAIGGLIDDMEKRIAESKQDDLIAHRDEISALLRPEIVHRFYRREGRKISGLKDDKDVLKAVQILQNREKYNQILSPNK